MPPPAIMVRSDALPALMQRLNISGPFALGKRMHRSSVSTARRIFLGECGANEHFIADALELFEPLGAKFEDLFKIERSL